VEEKKFCYYFQISELVVFIYIQNVVFFVFIYLVD